MKSDGESSNTTTPVTTSDAVRKLKSVQQRIWAVMGLKAGLDRLRGLGYEVVAHVEDRCATITVKLDMTVDFDSGTLNGKDMMTLVDEIQAKINELVGKNAQEKK